MLTEEVITNILLQEIHIGLEVRINRTDISPVRIQLICINLLYVLVTNKNVIYKIASAFCSTCLQQLNQLTTSYNIYTDGCCICLCHDWLLLKADYTIIICKLYNTETVDIILARLDILTYNCDICTCCDMLFQYLIVIQLVHCITTGNNYIWLMR